MGQLRRREDWPRRLVEFLEAAHGRPFSWGTFDCCLFACDAVEAMTGVDPARPFRGRYRTRRGAYAALKRFTGSRHCRGGLKETAERIAGELGMPEVRPLMAQRGDVVLIESAPGERGDALGIVDMTGRHVSVVAPDSGYRRLPLAAAERAWRV
jgi:hypothetical protein